ncbi:MAG: GspE/PulE family protein [Candidatus Pacebacteria bacterium]|jgi:type IV pilus assembly protein PilB|nr:GspE/PulE family protein [Candidatus Paceibacterota bacterium]
MSFIEELTKRGVIKESQASEIKRLAEKKYGGDIDAALIEAGMPEKSILQLKAQYYGMPERTVDQKSVSFDVLKYVPEDAARLYQFVPIGLRDGFLEIGITDPENTTAMDAIQFITGKANMQYKTFLITKKNFDQLLGAYKGLTTQVGEALSEFDTDADGTSEEEMTIEETKIQDTLKPGEEERIVEDAPIIKIVGVILNTAIEGGASDIHIENTGEKVKVRFRVDGILHTSLVLPMNVYSGVVARIKILAKLRLDEKRKPQDGGFSIRFKGRKIDFRVSTLPAYYGEKVVLRILDTEKGVKGLDDLGLSPANLALVKEALARPYGLILITGPTGSGKTTTLYSMINSLDREKHNIVSLEDPVEYHIPDVNQSQVMPEIGYTFAAGLRSILRQDPNIIMVGEIRDKETAELAIQAALTGHLVFSTLHTNSAIGVVPRLIDMGVDPYLIAPTLTLAVAQRLVRTTCQNGIKAVPMDPGIKSMIENQFADLPTEFKKNVTIGTQMFETVPTPECPTGVKGRVATYEMFKVDKDIENLILKSPSEQDIYKAVRQKGMLTMREDAILKALRGEIPFADVYNLATYD